MRETELSAVRECVDRSLRLFDRMYSSVGPDMGGWYHRLEANVPGPSATAVALHSYLLANQLPARLSEGLSFLTSRQVVSPDDRLSGGWSVNTSHGRPVLEATSVVARLLGSGRILVGDRIPDLAAAYRWIVNNQNPDGGWGSFLDQPSRVWLTAMAVRALVEINVNDPAVVSAVEWLIRERDPATSCWGERPQGSATVTHTGFVLSCLVESRLGSQRPHVAEATRRGYQWLARTVDTATIFDDAARIESYNASHTDGTGTITWQNSVWHPGLPFALSALIRDPDGADLSLIAAAVHRIICTQYEDGRWPNVDGAEGVSVWSVWPFVDALSDFARMIAIHNADRVTWLTANTVLVRRGPDSTHPVARLWLQSAASSTGAILKRRWAIVLLLTTLVAATILWLSGVLALKDSALALALPVLLVVIQELLIRSQPGTR